MNTARPDPTMEKISAGILVVIAAGAVAGSLPLLWSQAMAWAVQHRILIPASAAPLVSFPHANGAGLDMGRVAIICGIVVMGIAAAVSAFVYWLRHRPEAVR